MLDEAGNPALSLKLNGADALIDSDGDALSRLEAEAEAQPVAFIPDDLPKDLPSPLDPLTETIAFPNVPGVTVSYPALMEGHEHGANTLSFNALNEDGTDDFFTNINFSLQSVTNFDEYMSQGHDTAKAKMQWALETLVNQMFGDYLIKYIGTDFVDGGTYWGITAYAWMDGTIFETDCNQPVRATVELRYVGPTGYLVMAYAIGVESRINNYYGIACNMIDSVTMGGDWSTAPKPRPVSAGAPANGSDPGDYGTPYYWYDSDGDVWYWNGYENEFIGFGDNYYIDGDGYYESNDSGWEDDYYYEDYDPWSDPGDGDDFWSDPGDTGYYWDDDAGEYMESQGDW